MKKILFILIVFLSFWHFDAFAATEYFDGDIADDSFTIDVGNFTPVWRTELIGGSTEDTVNNVLLTVLEKLIIVFWVFSVFFMTIGAGYMIIYHGQDEFLSKWKSIFMSGLIALAVALSAWVIVQLFAFLLY